MQQLTHSPVLLHEALHGLAIKQDGYYIDGTFGRGGHSQAVLAQLGPLGRVLAIDKDCAAIESGKNLFKSEPRVGFFHGSFCDMQKAAREFFNRPVDGVLLDLGVSSPQLDDPLRGFSFLRDGPLDMRMDVSKGQSASDWLNQAESGEIAKVLWEYGEERFAKRIAQAIITARGLQPILRTLQLSQIVAGAIPFREPHKNPATRTFQAIRIFINQELEDLKQGLDAALDVLAVGGRLAVISFHSLEDRIVKQFMNTQAKGDEALRKLPLSDEQLGIRLKLVGKAIKPKASELAENNRARSAILRIGEKLR